MLNGRTELHVFTRGSVTGDRYFQVVILLNVRLFQGAIGADFIFMDGNARPHQTPAFQKLLESEDITRMEWPTYSPNLNLIEHVWDTLWRRSLVRSHPPGYTQQLKQLLIEEWARLPQDLLDNLVLSMERRCEETTEVLKIDIGVKSPLVLDRNLFLTCIVDPVAIKRCHSRTPFLVP
ncbi:Transposable element Tcb2 transposase, partial [Stegodyphus mimosarum]